MDKCSYCETETQLYDSGRPICLGCADDLDKGQPPNTPKNVTADDGRSEAIK